MGKVEIFFRKKILMPSPISYKVSDHKVKLVLSIDRYASQRERGTTPVLRGLSRPNEASDEGFAEKRTKETRESFTEAFDPVVQTSTNQEILSLTRSRKQIYRFRRTQGLGLPEGAASSTFPVAEHSTREGG